jgi:hypothetical protein
MQIEVVCNLMFIDQKSKPPHPHPHQLASSNPNAIHITAVTCTSIYTCLIRTGTNRVVVGSWGPHHIHLQSQSGVVGGGVGELRRISNIVLA